MRLRLVDSDRAMRKDKNKIEGSRTHSLAFITAIFIYGYKTFMENRFIRVAGSPPSGASGIGQL